MSKTALLAMVLGLGGSPAALQQPAGSASRSYVTGAQLSEACTQGLAGTPGNAFLVGCKSYVSGVVDALRMVESRTGTRTLCLAPDSQLDDLTKLVIEFLEHNSDWQQQAGEAVVHEAISRSFPCPPATTE